VAATGGFKGGRGRVMRRHRTPHRSDAGIRSVSDHGHRVTGKSRQPGI